MTDKDRMSRLPGGGYHIVIDPAGFAATAAAFLGRKLAGLLEHRDATIALSGGSTPGPVYEALAADPSLDWNKIDVYFADERLVPLDDPASNYRLARETLLDRIEIPAGRVHPMPAEEPDPETAAETYAKALPERLDMLILGLGQDGHTASLFPHSVALESEERVTVAEAPVEPRARLTITPSVIASARLVVVLARGRNKSAALKLALADTGAMAECPARLARGGIWILGRDTVDGLSGT